MLVSHRKNFVYTKTNKTAGTSIEAYFEPFCVEDANKHELSHATETIECPSGIVGYRGSFPYGRKWYNHMSARRIRKQLGEELWERYYKFCVVRNPFDKLVSTFYHLKKAYDSNPGRERLRNLFKRVIGKRGTIFESTEGTDVDQFRRWLAAGGGLIDRDKYCMDGNACLDFYMRYENLGEDLRVVCEAVDVPYNLDKLPSFKAGLRSRSIPVAEFFDERSVALARELYAFEFSFFDYPTTP